MKYISVMDGLGIRIVLVLRNLNGRQLPFCCHQKCFPSYLFVSEFTNFPKI